MNIPPHAKPPNFKASSRPPNLKDGQTAPLQTSPQNHVETQEHENERTLAITLVSIGVILALLLGLVIIGFLLASDTSRTGIAGDGGGDGLIGDASQNVGVLNAGNNTENSLGKASDSGMAAGTVEQESTESATVASTEAITTDSMTEADVDAPELADASEEDGSAIAVSDELPIFNMQRGKAKQSIGILGEDGENPLVSASSGKSTVFVIDCSGSMASANRFERVQAALCEALDLLKEDQEFLVIFFHSVPRLHPTLNKLLPATKKNVEAAKQWILSENPDGGGTNPASSVIYGLQQKAEKILLLTDGGFSPTESHMITQENKKWDAVIDCVGLAEQVQILEQLALDNGPGIYYQAR